MDKEITSTSNPLVKQLRALVSSKKARQESERFLVEGWRGIQTLIDHPGKQYCIERLVLAEKWSGGTLPGSIETIRMPDHVFDTISDVRNAQGILAEVRHIPKHTELPESGRLLLLDNVRDPGNFGTLIRSAVGAGFDRILLYGTCVEVFNPKVIRSSMGTFASVDIQQTDPETLTDLKKQGYQLYATTGLEGANLYETVFGSKTILAVGSEANGLSDEILTLATQKITIPLMDACESLNAAVAGSICMFQIAQASRKP